MQKETYVPKILLCGDKANFRERIGQCPFKIVGEVKFSGKYKGKPFNFAEDGNFLLDGKIQDEKKLSTKILGGGG